MESLVGPAVWLCLGLVGLSLVAIVIFGLRNLTYGNANPLTLVMLLIPAVLVGVLGIVMGDWAVAGIWASVIMLGLTSLALLLSGVSGVFG